jgi:hypothetical protein
MNSGEVTVVKVKVTAKLTASILSRLKGVQEHDCFGDISCQRFVTLTNYLSFV